MALVQGPTERDSLDQSIIFMEFQTELVGTFINQCRFHLLHFIRMKTHTHMFWKSPFFIWNTHFNKLQESKNARSEIERVNKVDQVIWLILVCAQVPCAPRMFIISDLHDCGAYLDVQYIEDCFSVEEGLTFWWICAQKSKTTFL